MSAKRAVMLAVIGLVMMLAGMVLGVAESQDFATNTPVRMMVTMNVPAEVWPSVTAAVLTQTARAMPTVTPMPSSTPAPVHVAPQVARQISAVDGAGRVVVICLFCVVVGG